VHVRQTGPTHRRALVAFVAIPATVAYLVLTWFVAAGRTVSLDDAVYQVFRPGGVWAGAQEVFGNVVDDLQPAVCVLILVAVAGYSARRQRSWAPLVLVAVLLVPTAMVILGTKTVVDRVDPAGGFTPGRGAYSSGHSAFILLCSAGVAMLIERPVRWWVRILVGGLCVLMALSLLWIGLHWFSDVVGGSLVGVVVLALACLLPVQGFRQRRSIEQEEPSVVARDRAPELPGLHNG
jgi:membrane-associated phospholipid phosphatase